MNTLKNIQNLIINFFFNVEIEEETEIITIKDMPLVIEDIIETYKIQLMYQDVLDEMKKKIKWEICRYNNKQSFLIKSNGIEVSYVWNYSIECWADELCEEYELTIYNDFGGDDTIVQYIGNLW